MSVGQDRVRVEFNPSSNDRVYLLKKMSAELIDMCAHSTDAPPEEKRLWHLAMTAFEEGAMWAVKAATYKQ